MPIQGELMFIPQATKTVAIQQAISQCLLPEEAALLNPDTRWPLQRAIAEARFKMLKHLVDEGMVPCMPAHITIEIRLEQHAIPAEATDGKIWDIDPKLRHLTYLVGDREEWLPWQ
jgi:hypothetical protein